MNQSMLTSLTWWIHIFVFLTLTKSQVDYNHGADHSPVTRWKDEVSAEKTPNHPDEGPVVRARPVVVKCHPDSWEVVVQADMFDTGIMLEGRYLRLGVAQQRDHRACRAVPSSPTEFTIQAPLMECGTVRLPSVEEKLVYANALVYAPEPSPDGLLRLGGATIPVECHYNNFYSVKNQALLPVVSHFYALTTADGQLDFHLKLMTEDWRFERESDLYYVGDPIHFEASSVVGHHKPLRVFVDRCVATTTPDPDAALRYDLIDHGCLADTYLTNSSARFLTRTEDHRLQFQLDAFTFLQEHTNQIYLGCHLTAVPYPVQLRSKHRACSLIDNRWRSADGGDEDCLSCAVPYPPRSSPKQSGAKSEQSITPGALSRNVPKELPATYLKIRQRTTQIVPTPQAATGLLRDGEKKKGTLKLGPLIILQTERASDSTRLRGVTPTPKT